MLHMIICASLLMSYVCQTCIVDYCLSGSRLKLLSTKDSCSLTFALSGVRTPSHGGNKKAEPYGPEALAYTRRVALQRECSIDVEACDKGGTFLGQIFIGKGVLNRLHHSRCSLFLVCRAHEFGR